MLRNLAVGIAIGVLLPLTMHYGINVSIGHRPIAEDYGREWKGSAYRFPSIEKEQAYKKAVYRYETLYFWMMAPLGLLALIIGGLTKIAFLGLGLIIGGMSCLTAGYYTNWDNVSDVLRFVSLLMGLILLIFMSYRIFSKER